MSTVASFVHEIELATVPADLDGDGVQEIYVAADDQLRFRSYRWQDGRFERTDLMDLEPENTTFSVDPW